MPEGNIKIEIGGGILDQLLGVTGGLDANPGQALENLVAANVAQSAMER